ncbi:hypothetical protein [Streptomyces canus]|uniref:hypothetical protein n=1 Tax=Streptomyces canus TaxID=58343 RepID=UPI002E306DB8|nr:hypothetical protein [Streptomyces canus]
MGNYLAGTPGVANAYRVLTSEGRVSEGFRWTSDDEGGDVCSRLTADGIRFTVTGSADPVQRLTADDLALLVNEDDDRTEGEDTARRTPGGRQGEETPPTGSSASSRRTTPPRRSGRYARSWPGGRSSAAGSGTGRARS